MAPSSSEQDEDGNPGNWLWLPPPSSTPPPASSSSPRDPFYVPGFEPSAPPEPWWHHDYHQRQQQGEQQLFPASAPPPLSRPESAVRPIDYAAEVLRRFWHTSHTVLRLDIRRPIRLHGPVVQSRQVARHRGGKTGGSGRYTEAHQEPSQGWLHGIQGGGAQLKLMQVWDFPSEETGQPSLPWNTNFGFGAKVEMDKGGLVEPLMRVQSKHLGLHLLPHPLLELHGKWPLVGTRLVVNIRYRIPLLELRKFWESPTSQLSVNFFNPLGTGFHLTPGGIGFDEHAISMGRNAKLRVAASIDFPRQFPVEEGEQAIKVSINRLGLKARIT